MPAAYDNYDYPSYWTNRRYEHESEIMAIKYLLNKIPKVEKSIEIGAGFGRLISSYIFRVKSTYLTDPSARLISIARKKYKNNRKVKYLQSTLQNLDSKKRRASFNLAIMVRVLHHINDVDEAFQIISKILIKGGYFILEFPNKSHLKANVRQFLKGDITYPINIFPVDLRSKKNIRRKTLPFINYHPDQIIEKLKDHNFEIIEIRSVSNIRSTLLKRLLPINILLDIEKYMQKPMAKINFGPSFFVLARKVG